MRNNFIGGSSATGGTGALTLALAAGLALPAFAFVAGQAMEYSIIGYSDATLATVIMAESGLGVISSGNVLTRSAVRTTWDGTTYAQAGATALSFGTSNVRVYCSPIAEGGPTSFPAICDFSDNYGPYSYVLPANLAPSGDFSTASLSANLQYMVPIRLDAGFALSVLGVGVTTLAASSTVNVAIASLNPATGYPGVILASANGLDCSTTGIKVGSITSRTFAPGWYWSLFNSNSAPVLRGTDTFTPGFMGGLGPLSRTNRGGYQSRTQAAYTVGASAMSGVSGSANVPVNVSFPTLLMR